MNLIRLFIGIRHGMTKRGKVIPEEMKCPDDGGNAFNADSNPAGGFDQVRQAIEQAIELLIEPTPAAIRQAGFLLENADECLRRESGRGQGEHCREHIREVEAVMLRAKRLTEGALRIQWAQMRRITAITQTYMRGGRLSQFYPADPEFDVKI